MKSPDTSPPAPPVPPVLPLPSTPDSDNLIDDSSAEAVPGSITRNPHNHPSIQHSEVPGTPHNPQVTTTTTSPRPAGDVTLEPGDHGASAQVDDPGRRGGAHSVPQPLGELPPRADRQESLPAPVTSDVHPSAKKDKKKTALTRTAKSKRFSDLADRASLAASLDELAVILGEMVATMRLFSTSAPTKACLALLGDIHERLANHHEFPAADESRESFAAIVSRSVSNPVKSLAAQVESQHKAIQALSKTGVSKERPGSVTTAAWIAYIRYKPKPPPLPNPSDERILVHFDGDVPPILRMPYPQICSKINEVLAPIGLPSVSYTQRQSASGLFVVPDAKEGVHSLTEAWASWGPRVFPGGRIVPPTTHCYVQVDGVPFAAAGSLEELKADFEERNADLGVTVGMPLWVNKPLSEARIAAIVAGGRKPLTAGSLFFRLQSKEMVDRAVARHRVVLAGAAPAVCRGFPHLRIVQCWGCYKFGHTRSRCTVRRLK
ncbi:hypothetical protein C8J57DRAFT_1497266 [Mycena rebaudengoi]|nr:hypothetical protein C8J57DRAFT_1497266 [Mycena rebaudengoi]